MGLEPEIASYVLGQVELELAYELLDINMGIADVKRAAERPGVKIHDAQINYDGGQQRLALKGELNGLPFDFTTGPFEGDPVQKAKQIAAELTMPAPAAIKGLASTLREQLQAAVQRAANIGESAKTEVANLNNVLNQADETISDVKAASADIQSALGLTTNGGPPLDGGN
jgi:hypothetical protein